MAINANYVLRETSANLTRNITLTVASVLTVFVSLAIVGTTVLVQQGAQNMTKRFEGGVEFIIYLQPGITEEQRASVEKELDGQVLIKKATYVDQEATFEEFKELFEDQEVMLKNVEAKDLPTSYRVEPTDSSVETVESLVKTYRKLPNVYDVKAATDVIRSMEGLTSFVNTGLNVFAGFLLIASALLILNTIRTAMFARRREIEVMKLVGATNWFIRVPFMLEGLVQGLIGGGMAIGFVFLARNLIGDLLNKGEGIGLLDNFRITDSDVLLACGYVGLAALLLSILSSALATRRFLDV